jgi:hypothetical protein
MPWSCPFEDPVTLPDRTVLPTLQDAADYMMALSAAEQKAEHWLWPARSSSWQRKAGAR